MVTVNESVLSPLLQLIERLYGETGELGQNEDDLQLWYNRGYADGMIHMFDEMGLASQVDETVQTARVNPVEGQEFLPWGKAYRHGFEMGEKESREALGQ